MITITVTKQNQYSNKMFKYDEDHSESIIGCDLASFNQSSNAADIFKTDQLCKDINLLYNNVKELLVLMIGSLPQKTNAV